MFVMEKTLGREHVLQMERLEQTFYGAEYITPAEESYACYIRYPYSTVAASDGGRIVGFLNLFPVREDVFRGILRGTYNDSGLTAADIVDLDRDGDEPLHMFLSCIAVEAAYRRRGLTDALLLAAVEQYAPAERRCDLLVTDNVTEAGGRFSKRLGLRFVTKTDHASAVYAGRYADFARRVREGGTAREETTVGYSSGSSGSNFV